MLPSPAPLAPQPTQHALLVAWGHFAHELDLVTPFLTIPIPQKTVHQPPAAKLLTLFLGLLSGCEYLSDLSLGPAPLGQKRRALLRGGAVVMNVVRLIAWWEDRPGMATRRSPFATLAPV
jgi:hypothetical protein